MRRYLLGILACFMSTALLGAPLPLRAFRAGAATGNITPALGSAIIGGFLPFPATNIQDELQARCLVLDDGKTKLALVVVDLLGIHYHVSHEARKFIEQEAGIPPTNVLISADYCGMYCQRLERLLQGDQKAPPMVALMANGTSGDVNHIDFLHPRPPKKPYEQRRFVADDLAAKAQAALAKVKYSDRLAEANVAGTHVRLATLASVRDQVRWHSCSLYLKGPMIHEYSEATRFSAAGKPIGHRPGGGMDDSLQSAVGSGDSGQ